MVSFNFTFDVAVSLEQRVAFELAARIWGAYLTDDVSINLHIASTDGLEGDAVGGAIPIFHEQLYGVYQGYAEADITSSQTDEPSVDQQAFNSLQTGNTTALLLNGQVIESNTDIALTSAQAKALGMDNALAIEGGNDWNRNLVDSDALDGYILVNQSYNWSYDFTRDKRAKGKTLDFLSMAMHEIGHNLGFVSGIDGAIELESLHSGAHEVDNFTALDLFRFSEESTTVHNTDGSVSDISVGGSSYFSIDGGQTSLATFSTGQQVYLGGDGYQASHWKRMKKALGIMDPTLAYKERLSLSLLDLQAMDVLGWDINYGALDPGKLDLHQLLLQAEQAVAQNLGVDSTLFAESKDDNDLYQLGYGALFQQLQAQMLELGYGALFQELEASFEEWRQDGSLLELGYGALFQEFEDKMFALGYGALFQQFEADMFELGYGELFQMFELGYGALFQQLDAYFVSGAHEEVTIDMGTDVVDAHVGGGVERIYKGGAADDILSGTAKQDRIDGGDGDDFLDGQGGHDVLWGDAGKDVIYGQEGNDFLRGGDGDDLLEGETGNDELHGDDGHDILAGAEGEDLLEGGQGRDNLDGGWDNDVLSGGSGDDWLKASSGHDIAVGGDGNDRLDGGSGHDVLYGDRTGIQSEENLYALKKQLAARLEAINDEPESTSHPVGSSSGLNPIRLEAEDMSLSGQYRIDELGNDSGSSVRADPNVTGESVFNGASGTYMILARYLDEVDGTGYLSISLNGNTLDEWELSQDDELYHTRTVAQSVTLNTGDTISFSAAAGAPNAEGRIDNSYLDYLELIPLDNLLTVKLDTPVQDAAIAGGSSGEGAFSSAANTIRVEAEKMSLAGEYRTSGANVASGGEFIQTSYKSTGFALTSFTGDTGFYDIIVGYYDEQDGQSTITAKLNDSQLDSWKLDLNLGDNYISADNFVTRTVAKGALINQSDVFELASVQDSGEFARIDYVDFVKVAAPMTKQPSETLQPNEDGLLAHWTFDERVGNRVADSVGSAHGVLYNTESTDWTHGAINNAFKFDGTDEAFHVSETSQFNTGSNSDFSVAFWTKVEDGPTGDWRNLVFKGTNNSESGIQDQNRDFGIYLHPDSNRIHYRISTTQDWNDGGNSNAALQENQWYHIAYVKEGNQLSLYIDGEQDSSVTLQGTNIDSRGELSAGNSTALTLDDLRIYNRALSSDDLIELKSKWEPSGSDDTIQGGSGNDVVFGGVGRDVIYGDYEGGSDSLDFYGAQFFKGSAYLLSQTGAWLDAQAEARSKGGNLITINTQEEESLIQDRYGSYTAYWIGINDAEIEGQWEWASGEAVTYTNWAPGQPDNGNSGEQDYGQLNFKEGQWDDNFGNRGAVVKDGAVESQDAAGIIELSAAYDDTLFGGSGDDALYGNLGNDYLYGESLASSLYEGLVAHWHFDEGSGLNRASVTDQHNGTLISANGNSSWTRGITNSAVDFGGNVSQMRVNDHDELDITREITIATWVNGDEFQNWDGLVTKGVSNAPYSLQVMENGQLQFDVNHATGGVRDAWQSAGTLTTGQWHHVAVTYDGEAVRFYIDGQLDANVSYAEFQFDTNDEDLVLGADLPGEGEFFDGQLDDTRLYRRALSGTEIAKLAESGADTYEYNGSTYLLTSDQMTWAEAQAEAESLGGNLVTVNDWQERRWLNMTFGWDDRFWLGLNDAKQEGNWQWASGEETDFTHWFNGDPDNYYDQDYVVMNWEGGRWADVYEDGGYRWDESDWVWEDGYRGIIEIKPPEESQDDVIIAGVGNDTAIGGAGDDIINGSDAVAAGYFERDKLWGGAGADTFVLGDQNQAYYQGEQNEDYALVKDFDNLDIVQLHGSLGSYTMDQTGSDTNIYYNGDLVAVFEKTTYTHEMLAQVRFV